MANIINKKVGKATMWSSITEVMAKLVTPFVNILLARLLLPEAFGIVTTITLVISFAEIFTDAGFQKYIIQHEFKDEDELNRSTNVAFWTNLSVSFLACLIIFIFRNQIARLVGNPNLGGPISIASLLILFHAFSSIQMARYKRDLDFKTLFFVRMGSVLIPILITVPMALIFRNYWALLIGNFANQIFYSVVLTLKSKWKIKFYYNFSLFKEMFSFTSWTLLESISIWFTSNVDIFIVSKFLSDHYIGLYKTSMSTINSYMGLVTTAVLPVLFSALSRHQNDDKEFKSTYYTFQRLTSVLVIPMGIGVFIFSDFVTMVLLGNNWMEASGFMGWWALTSAFAIPTSRFSSEVIRSKGKPMVSLILQLTQIAVLVPILLLVRNESFETLYVVRSLIRFEFIIVSIAVICIMFKFKLRKIILNILPSLLSATIMATVGYLLLSLNSNMLMQIIWILVCVVVYFSVLLGCFPSIRKELLNVPFVQKFIKKIKRK